MPKKTPDAGNRQPTHKSYGSAGKTEAGRRKAKPFYKSPPSKPAEEVTGDKWLRQEKQNRWVFGGGTVWWGEAADEPSSIRFDPPKPAREYHRRAGQAARLTENCEIYQYRLFRLLDQRHYFYLTNIGPSYMTWVV